MSLDIEDLGKKLLSALQGSLREVWAKAQAFAKPEAQKIAQTIVSIEASYLAGEITEEQARLLLEMQKNASRAVILAVQVIGLVAAEKAINDALSAVKDLVNKAVGFVLIA